MLIMAECGRQTQSGGGGKMCNQPSHGRCFPGDPISPKGRGRLLYWSAGPWPECGSLVPQCAGS